MRLTDMIALLLGTRTFKPLVSMYSVLASGLSTLSLNPSDLPPPPRKVQLLLFTQEQTQDSRGSVVCPASYKVNKWQS